MKKLTKILSVIGISLVVLLTGCSNHEQEKEIQKSFDEVRTYLEENKQEDPEREEKMQNMINSGCSEEEAKICTMSENEFKLEVLNNQDKYIKDLDSYLFRWATIERNKLSDQMIDNGYNSYQYVEENQNNNTNNNSDNEESSWNYLQAVINYNRIQLGLEPENFKNNKNNNNEDPNSELKLDSERLNRKYQELLDKKDLIISVDQLIEKINNKDYQVGDTYLILGANPFDDSGIITISDYADSNGKISDENMIKLENDIKNMFIK